MIVYKNKWFIINMEYPDTDWLGDADWVVSDDSELGKKIVSYAPNFDLIIKDGKLIDVKKGKITKEELDGIKEDKIAQSKKCYLNGLQVIRICTAMASITVAPRRSSHS